MNDSHAPPPSQQSTDITSAAGTSAGASGERKFAQIPKESVRAHAESIGISEVPDDVAAMVAEDACYRLREVMQVQYMYFNMVSHVLTCGTSS